MKTIKRLLGVLLLVLWVVACNTSDNELNPPEQGDILGFIEVSFSGIGTEDFSSSARMLSAEELATQVANPNLYGANAGLQIRPGAQMSTSDANNFYLYATYSVRNAQFCQPLASCNGTAHATVLENGTFIAVDTAGTIDDTAVSDLRNAAGANIATTARVQAVKPSVGINAGAVVASTEDFQAFTEAEITTFDGQLDTAAGVNINTLPFGFVLRCVNNCTAGTRDLAASPADNVLDGQVTFGVTIPKAPFAAETPHFLSMVFAIASDPTANTRVTQHTAEYGTTGADARATALGGTEIALLGNSWLVPTGGNTVTRICSLRTAGLAGAPTATLVDDTSTAGECDAPMATNVYNDTALEDPTINDGPGDANDGNAGYSTDDATNQATLNTITINDNGKIHDLNVSVNINTTFAGELIVGLRHVNSNTFVPLAYLPGNTNCQGAMNITFDDEAGASADFGCLAVGGYIAAESYRPSVPLSKFKGGDITGTWELRIHDYFGDGVSATLNSWSITAKISPNGPGMINNAYVTQSAQSVGTRTPLLKNRTGRVRAFLRSADLNNATTPISVILYGFQNGAPLTPASINMTAGGPGTFPTDTLAAIEADEAKSFDDGVPVGWLVDGLQFYLEVVHDMGTSRFPSTGVFTPKMIDAPVFEGTFVPVSVTSTTGSSVTPADVSTVALRNNLSEAFREMYRIEAFSNPFNASAEIGVHATVDYSGFSYDPPGPAAAATCAAHANNFKMSCILNALRATLTMEIATIANVDRLDYYHAVFVGPGFGGLAGLPGQAAATDITTGDLEDLFIAHEWGHNLTRNHIGGSCQAIASAGIDLEYRDGHGLNPAVAESDDGLITWGFNVNDQEGPGTPGTGFTTDQNKLKDPTPNTTGVGAVGYQDLMGYCSQQWTSAYNFEAVSNYRAEEAKAETAGLIRPQPEQRLMVIGGQIANGAVSLNPAFQIEGRETPPTFGAYTLELLDAGGRVLQSIQFGGTFIADAAEELYMFNFSFPVASSVLNNVNALQVTSSFEDQAPNTVLARVERSISTQALQPSSARASNSEQVRVSYDSRAYVWAMARDIATGQVLAISGESDFSAFTKADAIELIVSDGVISQSQIIQIDGR